MLYRLTMGDFFIALSGQVLTLTIIKYACSGVAPLMASIDLELADLITNLVLKQVALDAVTLYLFIRSLWIFMQAKPEV